MLQKESLITKDCTWVLRYARECTVPEERLEAEVVQEVSPSLRWSSGPLNRTDRGWFLHNGESTYLTSRAAVNPHSRLAEVEMSTRIDFRHRKNRPNIMHL